MANKLELTWIGKNDEVKIEPRLLIENKELSNCKNDENTENMIIHGDNLLALKALESKYAGKVKCIYIEMKTPKSIQTQKSLLNKGDFTKKISHQIGTNKKMNVETISQAKVA